MELDVLKARMKEQPVIYEEVARLQDPLKSSSPTIDVGENTAYVSVININACVRACARISTKTKQFSCTYELFFYIA